MDDAVLKIEAMNRLGLLTDKEAKTFTSAYKKGGDLELKNAIIEYAANEEEDRQREAKKLADETRAIIREDKQQLQKFKKKVLAETEKNARQNIKRYQDFRKLNELKLNKLEKEMAAADRKIDEIIADAAQKIEQEMTQKIREKLN